MDTLVGVAIIAGYGSLILATGWALYRMWRVTVREDRPVLMHRILERNGLSLGELVSRSELVQAAAAARRCVACRDREKCLAWLERDGATGYQQFCPNSNFIDRLKAAA